MHLGRIGYYADFVIYPVLVLVCSAIMLRHGKAAQRLDWLMAAGAGLAMWTFLEYAMHRVILHRIPFFDRMHDVHHRSPTEKLGTPSWFSLAVVLFGIFGPSYLLLGLYFGSALTAGIMVGYLWYICVHHAVHHWKLKHGGYLYWAKRRHAQHHHTHKNRNYGVTTPLWDYILGSALKRRDLVLASPGEGRS